MARQKAMDVRLLLLILAGLTLAEKGHETISLENVVDELKQLSTRLSDLEIRNYALENELRYFKEMNSELQKQNAKQEETMRGLEEEVGKLTRTLEEEYDDGDRGYVNQDTAMSDGTVDMDKDSGVDGNGIRQGNPTLLELPKRRNRRHEAEFPKVAFSVILTPSAYGPLGLNQIVQFDKILTNLGNGYHAHSGIFTAPVDGVYVFYVTLAGSSRTGSHHYLHLKLNGTSICWVQTIAGDQSSQLQILNLKKMDEVYISNQRAPDSIAGSLLSSFSGFLLYSLDANEGPTIVGK